MLIHSLPTGDAKTFKDFAELVFLPWIERELGKFSRLDIVWDSYCDGSLKNTARSHRGKGNHTRQQDINVELYITYITYCRQIKFLILIVYLLVLVLYQK